MATFEDHCKKFPLFQMENVQEDWRDIITDTINDDIRNFTKVYKLVAAVHDSDRMVNPSLSLLWRWTNTKLNEVKVVIIGQDPSPFHDDSGIAFSRDQAPMPQSLENMFRLLKYEERVKLSQSNTKTKHARVRKPYDLAKLDGEGMTLQKKTGKLKIYASQADKDLLDGKTNLYLGGWMEQGVLLLNSVLTITKGIKNGNAIIQEPQSHEGFGWEEFTDNIISRISGSLTHVVFILLGRLAENKQPHIDKDKHKVIATGHPSPSNEFIETTFFKSNMFTETIKYLETTRKTSINWFHLPKKGVSRDAVQSPAGASKKAARGDPAYPNEGETSEDG